MTATALILRKFLAPVDTFLSALQRTIPPHDDVELSNAAYWLEFCADRLEPGRRLVLDAWVHRQLSEVADRVEITGYCSRVYFFRDGSRLIASPVTEFVL